MRRGEVEKEGKARDASKLRVGVVVSDFNGDITEPLLEGALGILKKWRISNKNILVRHVPGAFEIPFGCHELLSGKNKLDAIITLGCVLKGETRHDEYIAGAAAQGIMRIMLDHKVPISFGVLTPNTLEQARARSQGKKNKGKEAALAALEMALK